MHGCITYLRHTTIWRYIPPVPVLPVDYQTNGARVRANVIVGILTHPLNRADFFRHTFFCLTLFC